MNHAMCARKGAFGIMKRLGSFRVRDFEARGVPFVTHKGGGFCKAMRIHLGRPFARGLRGLGRSMTRTFRSRAVSFANCRGEVRGDCGSIHMFHGTALVTTIAVFFVVLVKLVKCAASRIHHHDGRVTVHGIGKTRTSNVLRVLSESVLIITTPTIIVNAMLT